MASALQPYNSAYLHTGQLDIATAIQLASCTSNTLTSRANACSLVSSRYQNQQCCGCRQKHHHVGHLACIKHTRSPPCSIVLSVPTCVYVLYRTLVSCMRALPGMGMEARGQFIWTTTHANRLSIIGTIKPSL